MTDQITKKDLQEFSDSVIGAVNKQLQGLDQRMGKKFQNVDKRFQNFEHRIDGQFFVIGRDIQELKQRMNEFDQKLDRLMNTLDVFLKRLTDFDDEFTLLKAEVDQIKEVFKEKFGITIALQR